MDTNIKNIVDAIVQCDRPKRVILFGSHGRGEAREGSDVDIAVLYENLDGNPFDKARSLRMNLLEVTTLPLDILVYDVSDFDRRALRESSVENIISSEGVLAYG